MNNKKSIKVIIIILSIVLVILSILVVSIDKKGSKEIIKEETTLKELPKPEITSGSRGELGIDKNINEENIDEYLGRSDAVYRDMRMLEDPAKYEGIGGDRFLSGYIKGFEVIPLPYIIPVTGLPSEVGDTYTGTTLFYEDNGTYIANYEESMSIIENIFPKNKVIFLMCGGGGYAGMTKNFLVQLGWNPDKIYNVGGYWYYKGKNNINLKKEVNGVVSYDFDNVPYHKIEFDKLTKSSNYKAPTVKVSDLKINTSDLKLEEGTSFKLNAIVLPNEATNKDVKWTSSNEKIATVSKEGLVSAKSAGTAIITVTSADGNKNVTCKVTVNKKKVATRIEVDDISKEAKEFNSYDLDIVDDEYYSKVYDENRNPRPEYEDSNGGFTELGREEYHKYEKRKEEIKKKRINIVNKLISAKKSFIIIIRYKECGEKDYSVVEGIKKLLDQNNYSYLSFGTQPYNDDTSLEDSKINFDKVNGSYVVIIKKGKIYAKLEDSLKNDKEVKNWLSKYIEI